VFPSEKQDIRPYVKSSDDSDIPDMGEMVTDTEDKVKETDENSRSEEEEESQSDKE
jgi:UDP-N-acetylmuramyl tripeptide synthase